jgi:transglutaminase-like putative cysteine protease
MTIFTVRHITTYRYRRPVAFGEHRMMFRPRDSYDQRLLEARLAITPEPASLRWMHDVFGNCVAFGRFRGRAAELRFESTIRLDHEPANAPDFQIEEYAKSYPFAYSREEMLDLMPLVGRQYGDQPELDAWVAKFLRPGRKTPTGQLLMTLTCAIAQSFTYMRRSESGTQDPATTLRLGRGTCRDFALLMMERCARSGSRRASSPDISTCRRATGLGISAAARPMRGARFTCRGPAGWSSIRPTALSATATSSALPSLAIRARRSRSPAATRAIPRTSSA